MIRLTSVTTSMLIDTVIQWFEGVIYLASDKSHPKRWLLGLKNRGQAAFWPNVNADKITLKTKPTNSTSYMHVVSEVIIGTRDRILLLLITYPTVGYAKGRQCQNVCKKRVKSLMRVHCARNSSRDTLESNMYHYYNM